MAVLNKDETETLQDTLAFIDYVMKEGYTPDSTGNAQDEYVKAKAGQLKPKISDLWNKKGSFSS